MERSSGIVWFRGHNDVRHALKAGLFRIQLPSVEHYLQLESKFYQYYRSLGCLLHDNAYGWELVYSMQHHGLKTRLLDWTESFSIALYFALHKGTEQVASSIWMLDPLELNKLAIGKKQVISPTQDLFPYPEVYESGKAKASIAVYPIKNSQRICTQHGVFTVQGNCQCALNEEFGGKLVDRGYLQQIELDSNVREDAWRFLKQNGINHFALFPDLDGLAEHLNQLLT